MKITVLPTDIRYLRIIRFEIEIDPDDKLLDLKKKIEDALGPEDFDVAHQLVNDKFRTLSGDDKTLRELNINEENYINVIPLPKKPFLPLWELPSYKEKVIAGVRARTRKDARKANSNYVAKATLSMCKDPRYGVKVYTRRKNLREIHA